MTRSFLLHFLCAAFFAALASGCASIWTGDAQDDTESALFQSLRDGGYLIVVRHAHSPHGQTDPERFSTDCRLGDGRGLHPIGVQQAQFIGDTLVAENIPLLKAYTSFMCRAWDPAIIASGDAPVFPHNSQMTTDMFEINTFKRAVRAELADNPGTNIMLVSHSNVAPLYGAMPNEDEEELPEGVAFVVKPGAWDTIGRFGLEKDNALLNAQLD